LPCPRHVPGVKYEPVRDRKGGRREMRNEKYQLEKAISEGEVMTVVQSQPPPRNNIHWKGITGEV
jgi:hypothetical protein